jgi:hypothetical protein
MFAAMLIPAAPMQSKAQAIVPEYVPLSSSQLDQLVAPIALDPDPLVAQILIGCTFPDEVSDANNWLNTKMTLSPDQRATAANSMNWDPSIKGLVIFPVVLDSMAKNNAWTTQLGNAYYNQPDDVMDAIQAMRSEAYQSHALVATSQENVVVDAELIEILPVNPDAVFVQFYDPWTVFGTEVAAYPGFVAESVPAGVVVADGVSFEPAVSAGLDAHFGFSFGGWAPGWGGGAVVYNHNVYNSNSRTVANRGHFGGHDGRGFGHLGSAVPARYNRDGRQGIDRRGPGSRPMPQRISNNRFNHTERPGSLNRSIGNRSIGTTRNSARNTSNARMNSVARSNSPSRNASANRSSAINRQPARNNTPTARSASYGRSNTANHQAPTGRPASANRGMNQSASNRSVSQNRPTSPAMNRPNPAPRSVPASQSSRPAASTNSFGANQAANRPSTPNHSFGGNQAQSRPASISRPSGGFGGGHTSGKR